MKRIFNLSLLLVALFSTPLTFAKNKKVKASTASKTEVQTSTANKKMSAKEVIDSFYEKYFEFKKTKTNQTPAMPFSTSFNNLIKKNEKICKEKAPGEVCGFGADGDIYLDAQDYDDNLNAKNTGYTSTEPEPSKIHVTFNLFPSLKTNDARTIKNITFLMVQENGNWVVDDILYSSGSARKQIQSEIDLFK